MNITYGHDFIHDLKNGKWLEKCKKDVDSQAWHSLMVKSGMLALMDAKRRDQWTKDILAQNIPPLCIDTINGSFISLYNDKEEIMADGVINLFKSLSWDHKTNVPHKFSSKLIIQSLTFKSSFFDTKKCEVEIHTPRDREGSFEPQFLKKGQTRLTQMDDHILTLYAKGLSTREIVAAFKEMYDADVSATLISRVTDRVLEQIAQWQSRPLDAIYHIVYLDSIVIKIRDNLRVINKAIYLALGVNRDGHKELLGLWMSENEGAKFWLSVLTELKTRGVQDILIACVDGLKGFPDAIAVEFPHTQVQLCIVHMVRNSLSLRYVSWKAYKAVTADLKRIYQSTTEEQALLELERFTQTWQANYPLISKSWTAHWPHLRTIFEYPPEIRKAIYTTNAIESLNSVIRSATKRRKVFPSDESAKKVIYLAIEQASKKWTMPIQNWRMALNRFVIEFGDRVNGHQ